MQTATVVAPQRPAAGRSAGTRKAQRTQIDWRGLASLGSGIALIRRGQAVEIRLPGRCRAALGRFVGMAEETTSDGAALLGALSRVHGLELVGLLILPAQIGDARVRLIVDSRPRLLIAPLRPVPADDGERS